MSKSPKQLANTASKLLSIPDANLFSNVKLSRTFPFNLYFYSRGVYTVLAKKNKSLTHSGLLFLSLLLFGTYELAVLNRKGDEGKYKQLFTDAEKQSKREINRLYSSLGLNPDQL